MLKILLPGTENLLLFKDVKVMYLFMCELIGLPRFQSRMKTDNTNRLADPENLYRGPIYQVSREF